MGWFDAQIRERRRRDEENFRDAFLEIGGAIMGRRLLSKLKETEVADSAISKILEYYHFKIVEEQELPRNISPEDQLDIRIRPYGLMHREVELDEDWYKCAIGPMLGTLKDGSIVALIPNSFSGYSYEDINTGQRVKLNKKTAENLDRQATCFYQPLPQRKLSVKDLLLFMRDQITLADLVLYLGMMGVITALGLLSPMFTKWLFGDVLKSGSMTILAALTVFLVAYSVSKVLLGVYQSLISARISAKQNLAVEAAVMNRMMSLPPGFYKDYGAGELASRAGYIQSLCTMLFSTITGTSLETLFSLIYIGQIFTFAPALAGPALLVSIASLVFSIVSTIAGIKVTKERMMIDTKESGMSYAMITGIQKIKLAGAERRSFARWARLYGKGAALAYNPPALIKYRNSISMLISTAGMFFLQIMAFKSKLSISDYSAFIAAYGMVSGAFAAVSGITDVAANIKPILDMARPILEAEPEIAGGKEIVSALHGAIELSNVCFRYDPGMPFVVDGISLKINPGEYVAIVGSTGCGKSTLMRLMLGFETPEKGAVYFDHRDLKQLDIRSLRRKVGVVMQDGKLFQGDIYSNIVISAPELSMDDAWKAAEIASFDEDIRRLPMGMFTIISEGQGGFSGGQKQRLMIARAVAPNPRILMFDEATSALDNVTQKKVSEAIDKLKCTRVVIAHRLSTIRHCSRIIVLDKGHIVEDGTYEDLIAKKGFFADLVARQRNDESEA